MTIVMSFVMSRRPKNPMVVNSALCELLSTHHRPKRATSSKPQQFTHKKIVVALVNEQANERGNERGNERVNERVMV